MEVDEYQNYEKALGALTEAYKCLTKAKMRNQGEQEERLEQLQNKLTTVKKFVQVRRLYEEDPKEALKQCQILLEESDLDQAVRSGDVYALLVEHHAQQGNYEVAYKYMEEMAAKLPSGNVGFYINQQVTEAIYKAVGAPLKIIGVQRARHSSGEDGGEVEEEVAEEPYNDPED